jgi:hypothetical protein
MILAVPGESRALILAAADLMSASLHFAGRTPPTLPTPCSEWPLGQLVRHVADSASTLSEIIAGAAPSSTTMTGCARASLALNGLRQAVVDAPPNDPLVDLAALTGAFELTVHAWDVDTSTGAPRGLPAAHVDALVRLAPIVLGDVDRGGLFGPSVTPARSASDTQRLLALFGRRAG